MTQKLENVDKNIKTETRKSYAGLPTDSLTDAWMNDDLLSIDSDDEDTNKPLPLAAPLWADIASKQSVTSSEDIDLPNPPDIVPLKPPKPEIVILEAMFSQ